MKQDSKHWLQWKGVREGNTMVYARPWSAAINSTAPNYLRERFKEIREDIAWAEAMERQANYGNGNGTDLNALRDEWMEWAQKNPPSQQLLDFAKDFKGVREE
jgi:hypothetical protein